MSKRSTYPPGPWEFSSGGIWATSPWNARVKIATITDFAPMNGIDSQAIGCVMVAAPDMLAELHRLYLKFGYPETGAVIAKATGRAA
jgi:hypothetical protein